MCEENEEKVENIKKRISRERKAKNELQNVSLVEVDKRGLV